MTVSIDNEIIQVIEDITFESLIKLVNNRLKKMNKVIFEIYFDGVKKDLEKKHDISSIQIVEIITKSPRILLLETLNEMELYITKFYETLDEIYIFLSNDNYKIVDLILKAVDGLDWIYSVITSVLELTSIDFEKIGIKDTYFNFEYILNYFLILVKKEDYSELENFLKDDLRNFLKEIESKIPTLYNAVLAEEKEERIKA